MALVLDDLVEILRKLTSVGVLSELVVFSTPIWGAVLVGLIVGWAWKPKWAVGFVGGEEELGLSKWSLLMSSVLSGVTALALWVFGLITEQLSGVSTCLEPENCDETGDTGATKRELEVESAELALSCSDLEHLTRIVDGMDGGPKWNNMFDRSFPTVSYEAWHRDPENGPPQYRTRTVFEDATPEIVRDFFWSDDFRIISKWDDTLSYNKIIEDCPKSGTHIIHWVRKLPFFCSDREYIIARRIWESDRTYYCVTKGVQHPSIPRRNKPRRVDLFFSSWCVRAVESKRDGRKTACETFLFHYEDVGIPWELAKLGVRQLMWGALKKIEPGLRAYQKSREAGRALTRYEFLASINTKIDVKPVRRHETDQRLSTEPETERAEKNKQSRWGVPRLLIFSGAITLACTLERGLLPRTLVLGIARRFTNFGR